MALQEISVIDQITVLVDGQMLLRTANIISRDGVEIAKSYFREVIRPGQDVSAKDPRVRAIADLVHTSEVIGAFMEAADRAREASEEL